MNVRSGVALAAALLVAAWADDARAQLVVTATPSSFDFGTLSVGVNASASGTLKCTGISNNAMRVTGITTCAGTSTEFGLSGIPVGPWTECPGTRSFTVSYAPFDATQDVGCFTLALVDGHGVTLAPITISLSGAATGSPAPRIAPSAVTLSFLDTTLGTTATKTAALQNVGVADLVIDAVTFVTTGAQGGRFAVLEPTVFPVVVPPAGSTPLTVTYTPTDVVQDSAYVRIHSNDPTFPIVTGTLSGNGYDPNAVLDVDITSVAVAAAAKVNKPLTLSVATVNVGGLSGNVVIEVVAVQGGVEVYRSSQTVYSARGAQTVYSGFGFTPRKRGTVDWTVTLTDLGQDIATAATVVK
jgi:hypothetical protein